MDPISAIVVLSATAAGVAGLIGLALRARSERLGPMRRVPTARVADAPDGRLVRVVGTVVVRGGETDAPLAAPLSERPCVAWAVRIDDVLGVGSSRVRRNLAHTVEAVPFELDDGSGTALVEATGASIVHLVEDYEATARSYADATPAQRAVCDRVCAPGSGIAFDEGIVKPGERIAVVGRVVRVPDNAATGDRGYRDRATRVVLRGTPEEPLRISDDPYAMG